MPTNGGNLITVSTRARIIQNEGSRWNDENESEWEVDDADGNSDTDDEYDHDVRNAFDMFGDE